MLSFTLSYKLEDPRGQYMTQAIEDRSVDYPEVLVEVWNTVSEEGVAITNTSLTVPLEKAGKLFMLGLDAGVTMQLVAQKELKEGGLEL